MYHRSRWIDTSMRTPCGEEDPPTMLLISKHRFERPHSHNHCPEQNNIFHIDCAETIAGQGQTRITVKRDKRSLQSLHFTPRRSQTFVFTKIPREGREGKESWWTRNVHVISPKTSFKRISTSFCSCQETLVTDSEGVREGKVESKCAREHNEWRRKATP